MVCVSVCVHALYECGDMCVRVCTCVACVYMCGVCVHVWRVCACVACVCMCVCVCMCAWCVYMCACGAHMCTCMRKNIIHNLATANMRLLFMAVCTHDGSALFIPAMLECHYSIG